MSFASKYLLVLAICAIHVRAQALTRKFTVEDGLPQGYVSGIVQDKTGFLWIATRNGLARFDGVHFKIYQHSGLDSTTISSNVISTIFHDSKDRIWLLHENGAVDFLLPGEEKIVHYTKQHHIEESNVGDRPSIAQNSYGDPVIRTSRGICLLSDTGASYFPAPPGPDEGTILHFGFDRKNNLYVLTERRMFIYSNNKKLLNKIPFPFPQADSYLYNQAYSLFFTEKNELFISCPEGIVRFDAASGSFPLVYRSPERITKWCWSDDSLIYLNAKDAFRSFSIKTGKATTIGGPFPNGNAFYVDRTRILWVGTNGWGLEKIEMQPATFQYRKTNHSFQYHVLADLMNIPPENIPHKLVNNTSYQYFRWAYDKTGTLWVTNANIYESKPRLITYRLKDKKLVEVPWNIALRIDNKPYAPYSAYGISQDSKGFMWMVNTRFALFKLDTKTNAAQVFEPGIDIEMARGEHCLYIDQDDNFWLPSEYGLFHYREGRAKYEFLPVNDRNPMDIMTNRLLCIEPDAKDPDLLWFGSGSNGLLCFSKTSRKFTAYKKENGLPDNTVYSVLADKKGMLWCTTNKGIFRFDPVTRTAKIYISQENISNVEFNRYCHFRAPDGTLAFGGFSYHTFFNPGQLYEDTCRPNVAITGFSINNKTVDLPKMPSFSPGTAATLKLRYNQNFIDAGFAAMQFNQPSLIKYRYKLSGINDDWVYADEGRATYTNLPHGSYTLELNATNTAGTWSDKIKTLHIIIAPPWWQTWWAYSLYSLTVVSIIFLFVRNRNRRRLLQREVYFKEREAAQLKSLDEIKNRFFANITHEFRTPLSLIISPLEQEYKKGQNNPALGKVYKNAVHLLRLINQLLDMNKLEAGNLKLSFSRGDFCRYIASLCHSFESSAAQKNISFSFTGYPEETEYVFDADKWEKIVYNLLGNALKFTPAGGVVEIILKITEHSTEYDSLLFTVKDTGIGISEEHLPYIFNRFYQADDSITRKYEGTGIGLSFVKELTGLMEGNISVESRLNEGSIFTLSFRLAIAKATDEYADVKLPDVFPGQPEPVQPGKDLPDNNKEAPLVLVVEDNQELCFFIKTCLQPQYRVFTAEHGKAGLAIALEDLPDVIISDVMMPEMDGWEFCRNVKENIITSHIAFVLLTAKAAHESKITGLHTGADDYITKPFHVDELLLRIHNIIDRQEKLKEFYKSQLRTDGRLPEINKIEDIFLQAVYQGIENNIDNTQLDVERLANAVSVSRRTLNRKLTAITGMSANEIIRSYRLKKAAAFLSDGHTVSESAYKAGFETPAYFSKCFKEMFGCTPSEYIQTRPAAR